MLRNRIIVITGASSGIGKQLAKDFSAEGAKVIMLSRSIGKLKQLEKQLPNSKAMRCDVSSAASVKRAFSRIHKVDILVNNAGIGIYAELGKQKDKDIEQQLKTNVLGTIHCIKQALPKMKAGARIVNLSSILGKMAIPKMAPYVASKFAVTGLTEALHYELHKKKIWTLAVYPAAVKTSFFDQKGFSTYKEELHPGNWITPKKVSKEIIRAIRKNRSELYLPGYMKWYIKFRHLFSSLGRWAERRFYAGKI